MDPATSHLGSGSQPDPLILDLAGSRSGPDPPNPRDIWPGPDPDPLHAIHVLQVVVRLVSFS